MHTPGLSVPDVVRAAAHNVVLTPAIAGADGVSEVARQVVRALRPMSGRLDIASLEGAFGKAAFLGHVAALSGSAGTGAHVHALHLHLAPAAMAMLWRGADLTVVLHGIEAWTTLTGLRRQALLRARQLIAVSDYTAARFRESNPALSHLPMTVCHPACPPAVQPGKSPVRPGFALIVGRMSARERYKGHDLLLDAWSAVRVAHPDARLVIAGDGDDRGRLEEKASQLGLRDAVMFTGPVTAEQLSALYRDAAFFVMPSAGEGLGLVYLEAMRAGLACIATPGAPAELIEHGRTGLLVTPHITDITRAAVELFGDPHRRAWMGAAAAGDVSRRFEFDQFEQRFRAALGFGEAAAC